MPARLAAVDLDCADALTVATFWSAVLDRPLDDGATGDFASIGFASASRRDGEPAWLFMRVPEAKAVKNRMHVDLASGGDREAEVERLLALGARRLADKDEWGHRWTVLADPEGNEFCVS